MESRVYDLVIIGAGPTGISCGIEATKKGLDYLIMEKGLLVNSIYNFPSNMTFFSTADKIEIGDIPFISNSDKPTRQEALEYYRRLTHYFKLNISYGVILNNVTKLDHFVLNTNEGDLYAHNVILATGYFDLFQPLNVVGESLPKVKHYYDDAHPYIGKNIIVVGAANSACDVALETWSKGANVTMVIRGDSFYKGVKYWILPNIENRVKEGSIKAYFNSQLKSIFNKQVVINTPEGTIDIENDYVLAMTGYKIDYDLLERCGIAIDLVSEHKLPVFNESTNETNIPDLYIAGVLLAGTKTSRLFIENTRHHAELIINSIINKKKVEPLA
jgi:thioredoxin reductase (NADPH)